VTISWFGPQNQAGYGLLVAPQNRWEGEGGVEHGSRSRVSQSGLKTGAGAMWMEHEASSRRLR
jgi:hypothetical protein